jgi:tRNA pseudouridine38-40 synthase
VADARADARGAPPSPVPITARRTFRLVLAYDGTDFRGWQVQPGLRTVQGELERALGIVLGETVRVAAAGRTDRGVHALGQVVSFNTAHGIETGALRRALNSIVGSDMRVDRVDAVPGGFHARHSALSRTYRYHIVRRPGPIRVRYTWAVRNLPEAAVLTAASEPLRVRHAFDSFTSGEGLEKDTVCDVKEISWRERGDRLTLTITADRFLYRMVRTIVGTLVRLHRENRLGPAPVADILAAGARDRVSIPAPPNGLFLVGVAYPPDDEIPATRRSRLRLE